MIKVYQLLSNTYFSSRKALSTKHAGHCLLERVREAYNTKKITFLPLLYFAGAVDNIVHELLLYNLRKRGWMSKESSELPTLLERHGNASIKLMETHRILYNLMKSWGIFNLSDLEGSSNSEIMLKSSRRQYWKLLEMSAQLTESCIYTPIFPIVRTLNSIILKYLSNCQQVMIVQTPSSTLPY